MEGALGEAVPALAAVDESHVEEQAEWEKIVGYSDCYWSSDKSKIEFLGDISLEHREEKMIAYPYEKPI